MKYDNLRLIIHTRKSGKKSGCGYRYLITCGAMSHTAFRTHAGLRRWLDIVGLRIGTRKNREWMPNTVPLEGSYTSNMMNDGAAFNAIEGQRASWWMSNASYTKCFISNTLPRIVSFLNPNCNRETCCRQSLAE